MSLLEVVAIVVVLLCSLYVSYTDAKFRKIGNPYTYGLVAFGLACQGVFVYLGITTLPRLLWLLLGGLAVAFLMYYLGIWSPGDSKLFWGVSVALPPTLYSLGRWRYPPFVVAVNTFVPYFLSALQAILSEVEQKAHLLIVLAQMSRAEATELLRRVESVDAMVLGGGTGQTSATLG
jgi:Flp pilus assembly protein protease CpaA